MTLDSMHRPRSKTRLTTDIDISEVTELPAQLEGPQSFSVYPVRPWPERGPMLLHALRPIAQSLPQTDTGTSQLDSQNDSIPSLF